MSRIIFIVYIMTTSLALIILKHSTISDSPVSLSGGSIQLILNLYTFIGVGLYGLSFMAYLYLLSRFNLGYIVPITTSLVYSIVFVSSFVLFQEKFTITKVIGISLILIGFIFLNTSKRQVGGT